MADVMRNFGGSIPEFYDSIMGPAQFEPFAAELATRLPAKPAGDVLELACGTGRVTRHLRERLSPGVRLVATDISDAMLQYARGKVAGAVEWRTADASVIATARPPLPARCVPRRAPAAMKRRQPSRKRTRRRGRRPADGRRRERG